MPEPIELRCPDASAPVAADPSSNPSGPVPRATPKGRWGWIATAIKWTLCLATLYYVGVTLVHRFAHYDWRSIHFSMAPLVLSCAAMIAMFTAQLVIYRLLIMAYARKLPWIIMVPVAWVSALGKYLPGSFAAVAGKMYLLKQQGIGATVAFSLAVFQDGMAAVVGLLIAAPLLAWRPVRAALPAGPVWGVVVIAIGLICLHPRVFGGVANFALRKLHRPPIRNSLGKREYAGPLAGTFGQWLFAGLSLWLMIASVTPIAPSQIFFCIAAAALAMTGGYLVVFATAGLGPREAILLLLLTPVIGKEQSAIVVVGMRVAQTLMEMMLAIIGLLVLRSLKKAGRWDEGRTGDQT